LSGDSWVQSPDWRKDAQAMSDAAMSAMNAAKGKNFEELIAANGKIVETCEACHKQSNPTCRRKASCTPTRTEDRSARSPDDLLGVCSSGRSAQPRGKDKLARRGLLQTAHA
jgi:hypothetical protein